MSNKPFEYAQKLIYSLNQMYIYIKMSFYYIKQFDHKSDRSYQINSFGLSVPFLIIDYDWICWSYITNPD